MEMIGWELIGNQVVQGQHHHQHYQHHDLDATSAENITYPENKFIVGLKEVKETGAMFHGANCLVKFKLHIIIVLRP